MSTTPGRPIPGHLLSALVQAVNENFKKLGPSPAEQLDHRFEQLLIEYQDRDPLPPAATRAAFADVMDQIGIPFLFLSRPAPQEQWYYRARPLFTNHETLRSDPSQFGAPPAQFTPLGRANLDKHPVFYAADDVDTSIAETTLENPVAVYVSTWRSGRYRPSYVFSMATEEYQTRKLKNQRKQLLDVTERLFALAPPAARAAAAATLEGLGRVFVEDQNYALSSLIGHHYLYNSQLDGIEYPDATRKLGLNYALGPAMFDRLILHSVCMFHLSGKDRSISAIGEPSPITKQLVWRQFDPKNDFPALGPPSGGISTSTHT